MAIGYHFDFAIAALAFFWRPCREATLPLFATKVVGVAKFGVYFLLTRKSLMSQECHGCTKLIVLFALIEISLSILNFIIHPSTGNLQV